MHTKRLSLLQPFVTCFDAPGIVHDSTTDPYALTLRKCAAVAGAPHDVLAVVPPTPVLWCPGPSRLLTLLIPSNDSRTRNLLI